jgi:hypothetical protein
MRTLSSKALLAGLNPSPVFEAVAIFAEGLVLNGASESGSSEIDGADNSTAPSRTRRPALWGINGERTHECAF